VKSWLSAAWQALAESATSAKWWGENFLIFLVFTILFSIVGKLISRLLTLKYEGWTLRVVPLARDGAAPAVIEETLSKADVENCLNSTVDLWRLAKGVVGNFGSVSATGKQQAEDDGWLEIDHGSRAITIDLNRIPPGDFKPHGAGKPAPKAEEG
jgi:hypothetical protein